MKISVSKLRKMKQEGRKIVMLTAYDAPTAHIAAECGIDLLLVGDSLGMCVLGYQNTLQVTLEESLHHCKAVRRVAEKVEQETDGGLILEIYSDSALGDYSAVFDEVRQGTIDIAVQSISGEYDPALEVFYLPYLFTNYEESAKVLSEGSNTYKLIQDKFDSYGMVYMGCYVEGFVQVASNTFIDNMADPAAKKDVLIRCPAIESGRLQMDCQNFPTVTIPYADLYTSLQTKVCDGWMGGTAELNYVSFRDVIKYLYVVNCQMENNSAFMNKEAYEALPEDYQKILYDAFTEEAALSFEIPITAAFFSSNCGSLSRKPQASAVQPAVLSLE